MIIRDEFDNELWDAEEIASACNNGAKLFDQHCPGWAEKLRYLSDDFNPDDPENCPIGLLFKYEGGYLTGRAIILSGGKDSWNYGFLIVPGNEDKLPLYREAWQNEITKRLQFAGSYTS